MQLLSLTFTLLVTTNAWSGSTTVGDGGHGVLCQIGARAAARSDYLTYYRLEFLDLYEARRFYRSKGLSAQRRSRTIIYDYDRIAQRKVRQTLEAWKAAFQLSNEENDLHKIFDLAIEQVSDVKFRSDIPATSDAGPLLGPISQLCRIVQLGFHTKENGKDRIWIDRDWIDLLSAEDIAALLIHENLHAKWPMLQDTRLVRQIVTYISADVGFQLRNKKLFEKIMETERPLPAMMFQ